MTRKEIITKLKEMGFHEETFEGDLCAYEALRSNLRANRIPLKDIESITLDEQGELRANFETGLDYATGYFLEYESPNYWLNAKEIEA